MNGIAGKSVLLVEDEALVAMMIVEILERHGATIVGPATSLPKAQTLAENGYVDLALLDVNLRGESIAPIAAHLFAVGTPMVFVTGYGARPPGPWIDAPVIGKPFTEADLVKAIRQALNT